MNFHLVSELVIVLILVVITVITNKTGQIEHCCGRLIALGTRHDFNSLRILVGDMSNKDAIRIQSLRAAVGCDLNFSINILGHSKVQDQIVTVCLFSGITSRRIVVNVVQDTGDCRIFDLNIILEVCYILAEQVQCRIDVSVGDKRQVGFPVTSSSSAIADLMRTFAPEIRVSISCLYLLKSISKSLKDVISPPLVAPT